MTVNTLLFIALHVCILRNLIKPDLVGAQDPRIIRKSFVGAVSYLLGAAAAWFRGHAAFLLCLLTPLFFIVPPQSRRGARPGEAPDAPQAARR